MAPSRLFRSRLLWLGLPGLVFLIWAWVDSISTARTLLIGYGNTCVRLGSGAGLVGVAIGPDPWMNPTPDWYFNTETMRADENLLPLPSLRHFSSMPFDERWAVEATYRMLTLLYSIFWILSLWLRRRVAKRLILAHEPDVPRGTL